MANELKHKATAVSGKLAQTDYEATDGHKLDGQTQGDIITATSADQLSRANIAAQQIAGRLTGENVKGLTTTEVRTLINVEDGADVTDATNVAAAGAVMDGVPATSLEGATIIDTTNTRNIGDATTPIVARVYASDAPMVPAATDAANLIWLCDGTADEVQINAAIDALTADRTHKETIKLVGSFSISATVLIDSYTILDLTDARLTLADAADVIMLQNRNSADMGNTDIDVVGGVLDGNKAGQTPGGTTNYHTLQYTKVTRGTAKYITAVNSTGCGIGATNSCEYIIISHNYVSGHYNAGIMINSSTTNFVVSDNIANDNPGNGANDGDGIEVREGSTGGLIANNICNDNNEDGIEIIASGAKLVITGNRLEGNGAVGISLFVGEGTAEDDMLIANNIIHNSGSTGIQTSGESTDITIIGNQIDVTGSHGISLGGTRLKIQDNIISNTGGTGAGIQLSAVSNSALTGNIIYNCARSGINVFQSSNNVIVGNLCYDNSQSGASTDDGIRINADGEGICTGNLVTGNKCYDAQETKTQSFGIREMGDADGNFIFGNKVSGNLTSGARKIGSATILRNNAGYVTENSGTATLANTTTSIAVNHGLDVTPSAGDIMVTPMESLGNATYFYIDTYTSTQFTIHVNTDPGADVDFAWKAICLN